jgi:polyisoprenoid-binding protein YceI
MSRRTKLVLAVVTAVVVVAGGATWWFLGDDPPDDLSVEDVVEGSDGGSGGSDGSGGSAELAGSWAVADGEESQAGLRITESFVGGLADHVAVGRPTGVTGTVEVEDRTVTAGSFTVDLTGLEWSDSPGFPTTNRSVAMRDQALETDTYPEATFELTETATVDELPAAGEPAPLDVTGELTLHGVARETTFTVEVVRDGDRLVVGTAEPVTVVLADHEIEEPQQASIAGVADEGSFEFLVVLEQGG